MLCQVIRMDAYIDIAMAISADSSGAFGRSSREPRDCASGHRGYV